MSISRAREKQQHEMEGGGLTINTGDQALVETSGSGDNVWCLYLLRLESGKKMSPLEQRGSGRDAQGKSGLPIPAGSKGRLDGHWWGLPSA